MTTRQLSFKSLTLVTALALGATSPDPGSPYVMAYSQSLDAPVQWNGTSWTYPVAGAGNLKGTTLASNVTTSSLTSLGTLTTLGVSGSASINNLTTTGTTTLANVSLAGDLTYPGTLYGGDQTKGWTKIVPNLATGTPTGSDIQFYQGSTRLSRIGSQGSTGPLNFYNDVVTSPAEAFALNGSTSIGDQGHGWLRFQTVLNTPAGGGTTLYKTGELQFYNGTLLKGSIGGFTNTNQTLGNDMVFTNLSGAGTNNTGFSFVNGRISITSSQQVVNAVTSAALGFAAMAVWRASDTAAHAMHQLQTANNNLMQIGISGPAATTYSNQAYVLTSGPPLILGTNYTERARVNDIGIGIGVNPTVPLHVSYSSTQGLATFVQTNANGYAAAAFQNNSANTLNIGVGGSTAGVYANQAYIASGSAIPLVFGVQNSNQMRLLTGSTVGGSLQIGGATGGPSAATGYSLSMKTTTAGAGFIVENSATRFVSTLAGATQYYDIAGTGVHVFRSGTESTLVRQLQLQSNGAVLIGPSPDYSYGEFFQIRWDTNTAGVGPGIHMSNRGSNAQSSVSFNMGDIWGSGYRDVANPAYACGINFRRYASSNGLASDGVIELRTTASGLADKTQVPVRMAVFPDRVVFPNQAQLSPIGDATWFNTILPTPVTTAGSYVRQFQMGNLGHVNLTYQTATRFYTYDYAGNQPGWLGCIWAIRFADPVNGESGNRLTLDGNGNLAYTGGTFANSDRRLKTNVRPITNALGRLRALAGVQYEKIESGVTEMGLIAQEVQKVFACPVRVQDPSDSEQILGLNYVQLIAPLIEAIKELADRLELLEG